MASIYSHPDDLFDKDTRLTSAIRSSAIQSSICTFSETSNVLPDGVCQANERVFFVHRLRKRHSADLDLSEKDWIDHAIQNTKDAIAAATKSAEPVLESVDVRPRWFPDSFVLQRLKYLIKDSPETRAHSEQLLLATQSLNRAMEILSSCERRKPPTIELPYELSEFLNRRRLTATNHSIPSLDGSSRGLDKAKLWDVPSETHLVIEPLPGSASLKRICTTETTSFQIGKRYGMGIVNGEDASPVDYLQRIGRALEPDTDLGMAMAGIHQGSDYQLGLIFEAADIWRHKTETALDVATQDDADQKQRIKDKEAQQAVSGLSEYPEASSTSAGAAIDDRTVVSTYDWPDTKREQTNVLGSGLMSTRMQLTTASSLTLLAHPTPAWAHLPQRVPRRKPLPTMASFSSSQSTNGALSSANDWHSCGTEDTDFPRPPRMQPLFQDADKQVASPTEEASTPLTYPDASASSLSFERDSAVNDDGFTPSVAMASTPTYQKTRGRAWLEQRAGSQGW